MVICLERGANDLHMVQLMPLPPHHLLLQQNPEWFILLVPAYPGCPGKKAVKRLCVCVCVCMLVSMQSSRRQERKSTWIRLLICVMRLPRQHHQQLRLTCQSKLSFPHTRCFVHQTLLRHSSTGDNSQRTTQLCLPWRDACLWSRPVPHNQSVTFPQSVEQ